MAKTPAPKGSKKLSQEYLESLEKEELYEVAAKYDVFPGRGMKASMMIARVLAANGVDYISPKTDAGGARRRNAEAAPAAKKAPPAKKAAPDKQKPPPAAKTEKVDLGTAKTEQKQKVPPVAVEVPVLQMVPPVETPKRVQSVKGITAKDVEGFKKVMGALADSLV